MFQNFSECTNQSEDGESSEITHAWRRKGGFPLYQVVILMRVCYS